MTDIDCYDKPVPALVAKADVHRNPAKTYTLPGHVHKRARKPIYLKDKQPDEIYPCESTLPGLPSAAIEPEPLGEFTPVPLVDLALPVTFEQEPPEVPPTFETASGYPAFGGGGYSSSGYAFAIAVPSPVPEPSTLAFLGAGLLIVMWRRR